MIQTSKGLSGKNFNYLEGKPELRLLKVKIPAGLKTPIHTHPSPMLIHVTRGRLKHVRGEEINFFKAGDAFIESNNGGAHYVKNIGKKPAILHVGVVSVVGMPTTINNIFVICSICILRIELFMKSSCSEILLHS